MKASTPLLVSVISLFRLLVTVLCIMCIFGVGTRLFLRKGEEMKASTPLFRWLFTVLCIICIFGLILSVRDALRPGLTIWQQVGAIFVGIAEFLSSYDGGYG
jgi:hypothetical protein